MLPCSGCDRNAATRRVSHGGGAVAFPVCDRRECANLMCASGAASAERMRLVGPRVSKRQREEEEEEERPQRIELEPTLTGVHGDVRREILSRVPLVDLLGTVVLLDRRLGGALDSLDWRAIYARSIVPFYGAREDLVLGSWRAQAEAYLTSCDLVVEGEDHRVERLLPFDTARECGAFQFYLDTSRLWLQRHCVVHAPAHMPRGWWPADGGPLRLSVMLKDAQSQVLLSRVDYVGPSRERSEGRTGSVLARSEPYTGKGVLLEWFYSPSTQRLEPVGVEDAMTFTRFIALVDRQIYDMERNNRFRSRRRPPKRRPTIYLTPSATGGIGYQMVERGWIPSSSGGGAAAMGEFFYMISAYRCVVHLPPVGTDRGSIDGWKRASFGPGARVIELPQARKDGTAAPGAPGDAVVMLDLLEHVWLRPRMLDSGAHHMDMVMQDARIGLDERFADSEHARRWKEAYQGGETGAIILEIQHKDLAHGLQGGETGDYLLALLSLGEQARRSIGFGDTASRSTVFRTSATGLVVLPSSAEGQRLTAERGHSYNIAARMKE